MELAMQETLAYTKERQAFGKAHLCVPEHALRWPNARRC